MAPKNIATGEFNHILRILNTNVDGTRKISVALTAIRGMGRRFSVLVCQKAGVDINKRAGELSADDIDRVTSIIMAPQQFQIPEWFLNRQRDIKDGVSKHVTSASVDSALRDDLERMKKVRLNRGLRHFWGYRVRGQHTKTTGRYGLADHLSKMKK